MASYHLAADHRGLDVARQTADMHLRRMWGEHELTGRRLYLAVWTSIANSKGSVNGFTANDFITYYMTLLIVDQITSNIVIHTFAYKIQDGSLSSELIRPIHPMLTNALVNNIAFKMLTILGLIPIWIVIYLLMRPDFSEVTGRTLLGAISQAFFSLSLGMGVFITYGSYLQRKDEIPISAASVAGLDTLAALLAGLVDPPVSRPVRIRYLNRNRMR